MLGIEYMCLEVIGLRLEKLKKLNERVKKDEEAAGDNANTATQQK